MIRYSAWHKSEPGFRSPDDVKKWIDRQERPDDWVVVATSDDFEPEEYVDELHDFIIADAAVKKEQRRIAILLGLSQVLK